MIPKNTKIVTKEMIRQLEIEQTEVLKELQRHYSWFNMIKHQFSKIRKESPYCCKKKVW